ncbi:MAG: fluoride exporter [Solirubrobacteraceae bacterium]|nr:fluoride exporter [Solirubrobacteraceae bacterium]
MTLPVVLAIGVLGGLGSIARLLVGGAVMRRVGGAFPCGTLAVNLSGSLLLGVLAGAALGSDAYRLAATGLLGAYTTFSAWMLASHRLALDGRPRLAAANVAGSLVLGVAAVWLGRRIGLAL